MQLFMFLYMGIFFDTTLRGLLHCYIVTFAFSETHEKGVKKWSKNSIYKYIYIYIYYSLIPSGVHFCKCNNVTM